MSELLGEDFRTVLADCVAERMQELHDASTHSFAAISEFVRLESQLRFELWQRIEAYEKYASAARSRFGMRSFDWRLETRDRVISCFEDRRGLQKFPLDPDEMRKHRVNGASIAELRAPWPGFPVLALVLDANKEVVNG